MKNTTTNNKLPNRTSCPTNDFEHGKSNGKCWGDGHYLCNVCKHLRFDFKNEGWKKRDMLLHGQGFIQISN